MYYLVLTSPGFLPSSAVHLLGHYIRQEDFDQDPYSDSEEGSEFGSDDESIDSNLGDDLSALIGGDDEDESFDEAEETARITEILAEGQKEKKEKKAAA